MQDAQHAGLAEVVLARQLAGCLTCQVVDQDLIEVFALHSAFERVDARQYRHLSPMFDWFKRLLPQRPK